MLFEAVFIFILSRVLATDTSQGTIILILLGYGVGVGLAIAQLTNIVLSQVPQQRLGAGSGANNTLRQVGAALGIAVIGAVLSSTLSVSAAAHLANVDGLPGIAQDGIVAALDKGATIGEGSLGGVTVPEGMGDPKTIAAVGAAIRDAFIDASRAAALIASVFVLLGAVSSLLIPRTMRRDASPGKGDARV